MTPSSSEATGLSLDQLLRPDIVGPKIAEATGDRAWTDFDAELIAGGKSNLTFTLRSDAGELILRRPPTGKLLPSAHDMGREARIQLGLADTDVPVAKVVLNETTGEDLGVPYYVMEKVVGHVIRDVLPPGFAESDDDKAAMADAQIDALVALHAVDQDAVGLSDLGRPEGYLERQLRRWLGQSEKSSASVRAERLPDLAARLGESMPTSPSSRIIHGDYRLDNYVVDPDDPGRIKAILDWELSTLGDPVADLAQTVLYWGDPDGPTVPLIPTVTTEPGWPGPQRLLDRYCDATGTDPSHMPWYLAFATFKFAAIAQGVATRSEAGDMAGQDFGDIGPQIRELVDHGHSILDSRKGTTR
ncbi:MULTISPECIES: phosphotransferase family protein [Dietzia]|uniref:phosphotransferase family protein n=1 Tax=Dietzia TaxID=37914 RepID=UPI000D08F45B|nr:MULTISPECIES: phosphotransferase family protein [Dietzia]AVM63097.1 phosphotransferase family protein [Dietzia sp. oral taxon 368]MCT1712345.1 phosphotransferase family protein [Dietzia cinnamea]MCT2057168.1 phosphotransferase family protein [Dietzia cinnamea]MCT2263552.1 phosphotransferase family protein [Dietzia cinnamea]MCT2273143.1 phosphotransferase family protein [Dietzia cinnamea]